MRWFTSDLHLFHANCIAYCDRPFSDVDDMNAGLLARWNEVVRPDDHVVILGDLTLKNPAPNGVPAPWLAEWLAAAHGMKELFAGNHDKLWSERSRDKWRSLYEEVGVHWVSPKRYGLTLIRGEVAGLSHLPHTVTAHEDVSSDVYRASIPLPDSPDMWRLHGHVHTQWLQRGRQINVGVDAWKGRPVSEVTIAGMMYSGPAEVPVYPWEA
jgi:calcineurin-like phosphoesterase family protein